MRSAVSWTSDELSWSRYGTANCSMEEAQPDGENCENQGEDEEQTEEITEEQTEETNSKADKGNKKIKKSHKWCSVPFCSTRFPRDNVSFHKFPKNSGYRKQWGTILRITKNISDSMAVCSRHFVPSDYFPTWKPNAKKRLKLIAVPSENLPTDPADNKKSPSELKKKEDRAARAAKRMQRPRRQWDKSEKSDLRINKISTMKSKRWCSVPQCAFNKNASMHTFPKDSHLRKQWIIACKIGKEVTSNMFVCGDHFLPQDFFPRLNCRRRVLKAESIPTQNLPKRKFDKVLSSEEEKKIKQRTDRLKHRKLKKNSRILSSAPVKKTKPELVDDGDSITSEPVSQAETEVETPQTPTEIVDEVIPPNKNTVTTAVGHAEANSSNNLCTCVVRTEFSIQKDENFEIKAARILLELHEKVFELVKIDGITFQVKNIILKLGEDFYFAARRYCKSPFLLYFKNAADLHAFSGIDFGLLSSLCKSVTVCESGSVRKYKIDLKERIVLCLMKIRLDLAFSSLGDLFHINESDAKIAFFETVPSLKTVLRSAIYWPTKDEIAKSMPESLENFKKTVTVFDCSEVHIKKVTCPQCRLSIPSRYNGDTLKILLGVAECGLITYVGKAQAGRASNERITDENYISKILIPSADAIMTEGVLIEQHCNKVFIKLLNERKNNLFCPDNIIKAKKSKNDLDNAFQRFKMFKMLQSPIPSSMTFVVDDISVIVCALANLSNPVIADKKF